LLRSQKLWRLRRRRPTFAAQSLDKYRKTPETRRFSFCTPLDFTCDIMLQSVTPTCHTRLLLARYRSAALGLGYRNKAII